MLGVELLVRHDEGEERDGLAGSGWHFQDAVPACVQGSFKI